MKKIISMIVKIAIIVAVLSLLAATNQGYVSRNHTSKDDIQMMNASADFYANITFQIYEGEGCGCVPLRDVPINASGRDTDHSTSGVTDENGTCILQLEYDKRYQVSIQEQDHESVLFDFVVIDDQAFSFHLKVIEDSSHNFLVLKRMLQKIINAKKLIN